MSTPAKLRQHVRYLNASDGTRLAWAESGAGPLVVKAANWLTHLEYEWESPVWKHWMQFFSAHFRFVRYDERGCGLSDGQTGPLSLDQWVADLGSVIDAARPDGPVTLLGISQGAATCIRYALRHPERVSRIILYGGYARGWRRRDSPAAQREYQAMVDLMRVAWGKDNPTFRQVFTSRFIPGGSPEQLQWFNDLCLKTTSGNVAANLQEARSVLDISGELGGLTTPTLVLHARDDAVCPIAEGRLLASAIPGAEFVELDSRNHILLEHEPAWQRILRRGAGVPAARAAGRRFGVRRAIRARTPGAGAHGRRLEQRRHRRAAADQREDRPQPRVESVRQARRVVAGAGDRLRTRARLYRLSQGPENEGNRG